MVIDCHMHVRQRPDGSLDESYCDRTVEAGDFLGIDQFCISDLDLRGDIRYDRFHAANERVWQAIQRHPDRYLGYCFVNPGDPRALDEINHRVRDQGFIGIKLYNQYQLDEPVLEPILERAIQWRIPILQHAGYCTDAATAKQQERISNAGHIARAAQRYPEAILIEGHIGGGGDWEWALKHLREAPSVFIDTSGSVVDEWMLDRCIAELGAGRLLFATDMSMESGVGKILDAHIVADARAKILGGNFHDILAQRAVS